MMKKIYIGLTLGIGLSLSGWAQDTTPPTYANCPQDIEVNKDPNQCSANVSWNEPMASDNSGSFTETKSHNPGDSFPLGKTEVTYVVEDGAGLTDTCSFWVTVIDNSAGEDGSYATCPSGNNFFLFNQLNGNPVSGGDFFNPSGNLTSNDQNPSNMAAGNYMYVVDGGCGNDTAFISVRLDYTPPKPNVSPSGIVNACDGDVVQLVSSSISGNQWYKNGNLMLGEVNQDLIITEDGDYWVKVNENGCQSVNSDTAQVRFNPVVDIANVQTSPVQCNKGNTGTITVNATAGTPPYRYSINGGITFQSSNTFTNLPPNEYIIILRDSKGCEDYDTVSTEDPAGIELNAQLTQNISCNNENDAVITGTTTGGNGSYAYTLVGPGFNFGPQSSGVFSGLGAGDYQVIVADGAGCGDTSDIITVENPDIVEITAELVNGITCHDENDGFITASATGGVPPIEFSLNFGPYQPSGNFRDLDESGYIVVARDRNGCTDTSQIFIVQNPDSLYVDSVGKTNVTCFGADDGTITVVVEGGTPPISYSIDQTNFEQNGGVFEDLMPGTYSISVRDLYGCVDFDAPVVISEPSEIKASAKVNKHVTCFNGSDGEVTITASGGTGALVYGHSQMAQFQQSNVFTGLNSGVYDFYVQDITGCMDTIITIAVHQPQRFSLTTSIDTGIFCNGDSSGYISIIPIGGRGQIQYSLDDINFQTEPFFDSLPAGTYRISAVDTAGCETSATVNLEEPDSLKADLPVNHIVCAGDGNGHIRVNAVGGTTPYKYSRNGGNSFQTNANFYNLNEGFYGFLVEDANGCTFLTDTVFIEEPDSLMASIQIDNHLSCFRSGDGQFSVSVQGGRKPYEFSLDGLSFQPDSVYRDLDAGSFQVTVKDSSGCRITLDPITITQPTELLVDTVVYSNISCHGETDGEITVVGKGGVQGLYTFSIDNQNYGFSNKFTGLAAGVYDVTVQDASGCVSDIKQIEIIEPEIITGTATIVNHISCSGLQDGSISVQAEGGTPPYEYSVGGNGVWQSSNVFIGLSGGNYAIRIRDANLCEGITNSVVIVNPPLLSIVATLQNPISCRNANDALITVQGFGGTGDYLFSIDGQNFVTNTSFPNLSPGTYQLSVKDENGCISSAPIITVNNPQALNIQVSITKHISCNGANDGQITVSASGGTGTKLFSLDGVNYVSNNVFSNLPVGTHTIFVKDDEGCLQTAQVTLTQPLAFVISLIKVKDEQMGNDGAIDIEVNNVITPVSYLWNNGETTQDIQNLSSGFYTVTVTDGNGCSQQRTYEVENRISIEQADNRSINLYPNPNTGQFKIGFEGTWSSDEMQVEVYNELGEKVYHSLEYLQGNGSLDFDLGHLPAGLYHLRILGETKEWKKSFLKME